jgi:hypothetical protein
VLQQGEAKELEPEPEIRTALYETLLLFCSTRQSRCGFICLVICVHTNPHPLTCPISSHPHITSIHREVLRRRGAYAVLREADKAESSEENSEVIYKIVNFLQRCVLFWG